MKTPRTLGRIIASLMFVIMAGAGLAQPGPFPPPVYAASREASEASLDSLLAPIALYPDFLLRQVLAAATYPLEVIELHRWLQANPYAAGDGLEGALEAKPWDESVKALAPFASVVAMMNGELEWMQRLGDAYLADEAAVMDAVQRLRRKAREAGNLESSARERVIVERESIVIETPEPEVVYVPVYDPRVVYGPWWWPAYPPYFWSQAYFGPWDFAVSNLYFGVGVHVWPRWRAHPRPHNPIHRGGVPYADPRTRDRFAHGDRDRVRDRRDFRGFDVRPPARATVPPRVTNPIYRAPPPQRPGSSGPAPQRQGTSGLAPQPRGSEQAHSERGHQSLQKPGGARDKR